MLTASLSPTSYIVLGLIANYGPASPYQIHRWVDRSVGYFWSFPRSQLYAEPKRLVELGLLLEEREEGGRRKLRYTLTDAGQSALHHWLRAPTTQPTELRDAGILKLFFSRQSGAETVQQLAEQQQAAHLARLTEYEQLEGWTRERQGDAFEAAALRMGLLYERQAVTYWQTVIKELPLAETPADGASAYRP